MKLNKVLLSFCVALFLPFNMALAADKININTASYEELQSLNGVGASTATAIINYREQMGEFKNLESLVNVKGIGEKKLMKLSEQLTVSDDE